MTKTRKLPKSILDPSFEYVPSWATDISKRIKAEADRLHEEKNAQAQQLQTIINIFEARRK